MKIVVTGCAGFIGANFAAYILDNYKEHTVIGIDCLTYAANKKALATLRERKNFVFYKVNICNRKKIFEIFDKNRPDAVVNFAAESHVDRSIDFPSRFVRTNVAGTQVLLEAALKYGTRRFHQISTDEVYGDVPIDSAYSFTEQSPLSPSSPYSASKAAADMLVLSYFKTYGMYITISRSSNNFGIYQHSEKLIPKVVKSALADEYIPIYGDGENVRNWLHVSDHVRAVYTILENGSAGEIYNVGAENYLSNRELVLKLLNMLGKPASLICFVQDRKGHDRKYSISSAKLENELGWRAERNFEKALIETVEYYKNI